MKWLQVENMSKAFEQPLLEELSFQVRKGEILGLSGPSGVGKTTLLRMIAGLEPIDTGKIILAGKDITHLPTHQRSVGLMFQSLALWPHLNVFENIAFGLRVQQLTNSRIQKEVMCFLDMMELRSYEKKSIHMLSQGQQQRVALARALAPHPQVLLLDEPMSSLDFALKQRLQQEMMQLLRQLDQTVLYVSHDQQEMDWVADRVITLGK